MAASAPSPAAEEMVLHGLRTEQASLWGDAWRRLRRNRLALAATVYLVLLGAVAVISIFWTPYSISHEGIMPTYQGPTPAHPFGADALGRDILSRTMVGARISLTVGVVTQVIVLVVGVVVGLAAGYFRGWVDGLVTFVISIFYGIPDLLVAMIIVVVVVGRSGLGGIIFAIVVTRWMDVARLVRGQTLGLREREFVEAARSSGARPLKVMFGHIFPNALGPVIVQATFGVPQAILFEAFLSFLGVGVPPPTPSWGSMAADGIASIQISPHIVLFPSIFLSLTLMAFNFLGDGFRDALDPRQRR
ncbi:MAG: ABC transporter permease [Candidatus Dormibacteraceae bacterium]